MTKKVWFFNYDIWQESNIYLPTHWFEFKRYYELNGKHVDDWEWVKPVINYRNYNVDDIVKEAISHNCDVYMFSSYMWAWDLIKVVAHSIRQELPNSIIVLGGPHQNTTYTDPMFYFKSHPYFDATCQATEFGEFFITDMLDLITEGNLDWNNVRNSYHRKGKGPIANKRDFIYPTNYISYHLDFCKEISEYAEKNDLVLSIKYETNRGCMYKCTYCEWGGGTNTKVVTKDMDNIREDLSHFKELNIKTIWITDANFGILPRDIELSNMFAELKDTVNFVGITGLAKTKADKKKRVLEPLIKAGLVNLYQVSLQCIDEEVLKNVERTDIPMEDNIQLANELIDKYDIDVIIELILGLPGFKLETFYEECELEYSVLNSIKPITHHVPLYVLPDAPVGNPEYLRKFQIQLAPIGFEESANLIKDSDSVYVKMYNDKQFKTGNTLCIPVSSYSYTTEDWKEMFLMNDMNTLLTNMLFLKPLIDLLSEHYNIKPRVIFKRIFNSLKRTENFIKPIYTEYLDRIINGEYSNKSWKEFEQGPVTGSWSLYGSYSWLWATNKEEIFNNLRDEFKEILDNRIIDCLTYCENSTFREDKDITWTTQYRWDLWEENSDKTMIPKHEPTMLTTIAGPIKWASAPKFHRYFQTIKEDKTNIKTKRFTPEFKEIKNDN